MNIIKKTAGGSLAAIVALAFSAQAQNLIVNPGFEDASGFTANPITTTSGPGGTSGVNCGWALFGQASWVYLPGPVLPAHSGNYALLTQNSPGNDWNPSGAYQIDSGVNPGIIYTFDMWYASDTGTSYSPPVALEIGFLNSSLTPIGTVETGAGNNAGGFNYTIPATDTWYEGSVSATAPVGAVYVVVYAMFMDNGQTTTENVYFDDASIPIIPEPSSLLLASMGMATGLFCLRRQKTGLCGSSRRCRI